MPPARIGAIALGLLSSGIVIHGQTAPTPGMSSPSVVLQIPADIDPSKVRIDYSLGAGYSFIRTQSGVHYYTVETLVDGRPAASLRFWAYAPGFGLSLSEIDLTQGPVTRTVAIRFEPLASIVLNGQIAGGDQAPAAGQLVEALYDPAFECDFLLGPHWMDCATGPISVGSSPIAGDGRFSLRLPDFAHDPALQRFQHKGSFDFRVLDAPGRPAYGLLLGPPVMRGAYRSNRPLAPADRYDDGLQFFPNPVEQPITRVTHMLASELSPGLPDVPFGTWLSNLFGPGISWETDDCGEQTGNPSLDAGRDFPLCVTASIILAEGRQLHASIVVGTIAKGASGKPAFWYGDVSAPTGGSQATPIKSLTDLPRIAAMLPAK